MSSDPALRTEFELYYVEMLPILKALAHRKRLQILLVLLDGIKSFHQLLAELDIQKTALSNHLAQLIKTKLIEKPHYGRYEISIDGRDYVRDLLQTWKQSYSSKIQELSLKQGKQMSEEFLNSFFK
jgi:DNA-binding transcriptional ArsR family regulator